MGVHFGRPCCGFGRDGAAFPARSPDPLMEPTSVTSAHFLDYGIIERETMAECKIWIVRTRGVMCGKQTWRQEAAIPAHLTGTALPAAHAAGQADDRFARGVKEEICRGGKRVIVHPFPLMRETPCDSLNSIALGKVTRATA